MSATDTPAVETGTPPPPPLAETRADRARAAASGAAEALMPDRPPAPQREVRNQTPYRIALGLKEEPRRRVLHLAPWGSRTLTEEEYQRLDIESWESRSIVATRPVPELVSRVEPGTPSTTTAPGIARSATAIGPGGR